MITSIYTAEIKINKSDKDYIKYLVVINETGVLLVNKGLFVISFDTLEEFRKETDIKDGELNTIGEAIL